MVPYKYGTFDAGPVAPFGRVRVNQRRRHRRGHMSEKTGSRGEIFVVDDDPAVRDTLSMVLSAGGYEVICFADGAALLSVARTRTPACILLDVHIPGKSGLRYPQGASRRGLSRADLHDLGAGRYLDGGERDQERRARLHREAVPRQRDREPADRGDRRLCAPQVGKSRIQHPDAAFPRPRTADAARARSAGAVHQGSFQQGSRAVISASVPAPSRTIAPTS